MIYGTSAASRGSYPEDREDSNKCGDAQTRGTQPRVSSAFVCDT